VDELRADSVVREALGEHTFERYIEAKIAEWDEFRLQVTPWELEKYLEIF
ncbi:MAG: glutamine synthetase, partial [SAR202 cluster bacterium]|nr:glutamine synthetase [SAR202 cluster bacterium]